MKIIPAIDLINGQCVRLVQGDYNQKTIYSDNPVEMAQRFEAAGFSRLHLVDLDGAKQKKPVNMQVLKSVAAQSNLTIDFGGGIREEEQVQAIFESGAHQVVIGSLAVKQPELLRVWLQRYGPERFILAADVRGEHISTHGWQEASNLHWKDFIEQYQALDVVDFLCTDVAKDGKLEGSSEELYRRILKAFPSIGLIASGGVKSLEELQRLKQMGCKGAIVGKAIYEGILALEDLVQLEK